MLIASIVLLVCGLALQGACFCWLMSITNRPIVTTRPASRPRRKFRYRIAWLAALVFLAMC